MVLLAPTTTNNNIGSFFFTVQRLLLHIYFLTLFIITGLLPIRFVQTHFSLAHHPSQIACDFESTEGLDWLSQPLIDGQPFEEWWFHGQVQCQNIHRPPLRPMILTANGHVTIVMTSRVQLVPPPYGVNRFGEYVPSDPDYVMSAEEWGEGPDSNGNHLGGKHNIHSYTRDDTGGCALAIAYEPSGDATRVQPNDFVVFSVMHDCPKRLREQMEVPNLPATCHPTKGCICAWFWIPKNSGLKNWYMTPFVCTVVNSNNDASAVDIEYAIPPRRCLDPNNCVGNFGPRTPMYWLGEGHQINMPEDYNQPPTYSIRYGFREGAQHDIFVGTNPRRQRLFQYNISNIIIPEEGARMAGTATDHRD